jgi:hypothetical protein
MHRIASAILIAAAVLAMNAGMLRDAFADEYRPTLAAARAEVAQPVQPRSAKLLSLLVVLESLRQEQVRLDGQKV